MMKLFSSFAEVVSVTALRTVGSASMLALALFYCAGASAQSQATLDEMEKHLEQQRIALEQAIAERDATGEQAREVRDELQEAKAREQQLQAELETLCEEQAKLNGDSAEDCLGRYNN